MDFTYLVLIPLISFLFYTILLIIIIGSTKTKITSYYMFNIISLMIWSFGSFMMKANIPPSPLFWNRILVIGLICTPVTFYHFTVLLTGKFEQKWKINLSYFITTILVFFNFCGYVIEEVGVTKEGFVNYRLGPLAAGLAIMSLGYLSLAFTCVLAEVKSNKIPYARVKYILIGLLLTFIGAVLNLIPQIGKYPVDIVLSSINALLIAYSIYKYKFLEIKVVVKKGIAYSLYTIMLSGIYIGGILAIQHLLTNIIGIKNLTGALMIAGVVSLLVLQPIINHLQKLIDEIFYKENLNHQKILKQFSQVINNVLDLDELTDLILDTVKKAIHPKDVFLALKHSSDYFTLYNLSEKMQGPEKFKYNEHHPIIQWFSSDEILLSYGDIERLPYFKSLWSSEIKQLRNLQMDVMIPIKFRDDIIGMLIVTEKKGGESYSQNEIDLLYTLMNNAAVVIDNAKIYEQAKQQAITDGLTGLYNHRYFHEVISNIVNNKTYDVFSIAMIDVDMFKIYNDLYGHSAGDKVLSRISQILQEATDEDNIVARYGGEEFAIVFPNIEGDESLKAIEKLRMAVESSFCSNQMFNEIVTISVGVANYPAHGREAKTILDSADKAMYKAKQTGRNKALLYSSDLLESNSTENSNEIVDEQDKIQNAYLSSIYALAATIDAKDSYTYGHSSNVSKYAIELAKAARFDDEKIKIIRNAGLLHDIGKIGIPEKILTKSKKLSEEEYSIMKKHVDIAIPIIQHIPTLINVIPGIMTHHERYDGKGYPRGLKGENIPIEGRCLCIVDSFDAMVSDRPYRKALPILVGLQELKQNRGTQFDPVLTDIFIKLIEDGIFEKLEISNEIV